MNHETSITDTSASCSKLQNPIKSQSFYDSVPFWTAVCFAITQPSCPLPHLLQSTVTLSLMWPYFARYSSGVILHIRPHPHSGHYDLIWYLSFAIFYLLRIVFHFVPAAGPFLPGFETDFAVLGRNEHYQGSSFGHGPCSVFAGFLNYFLKPTPPELMKKFRLVKIQQDRQRANSIVLP